jgi:hypothetical protein
VYFKIHGTATPEAENTIVCDLEAEGWPAKWKRDLLLEVTSGRTLVVLGYSGRDFDICPDLVNYTEQIQTVWLQPHRGTLQPNARRVLEERDGMVVEGDLVEFLRLLIDPHLAVPAPSPKPVRLDDFDLSCTDEWRLNLLNWIACPKLLFESFAEIVDKPEPHRGKDGRMCVAETRAQVRIGICRENERRSSETRRVSAAGGVTLLVTFLKCRCSTQNGGGATSHATSDPPVGHSALARSELRIDTTGVLIYSAPLGQLRGWFSNSYLLGHGAQPIPRDLLSTSLSQSPGLFSRSKACCNQERGGYLLWVHGTSGQIADGAVLRAGSELPFCELIFRVEKSVEVRPEECYPVRAGCV